MKGLYGILVSFTCMSLVVEMGGVSASADDGVSGGPIRSKKWELLLSPEYTLTRNLNFDGGTTAKIHDTWGFGLQFGYNFNEHWNLGGRFSWSNPDYQAVSQPAAGNPSLPVSSRGSMDVTTFTLAATYNVLAGPVTPYIDTNIGGTYVDTNIAAGPPLAGCFWDPWYGYICGVAQPTKADTYLSFGVGGGMRWDINRYLIIRGGFRQQWVDLPNIGIPSFTTFKFDVGFKF
ncbi:MAG TPA: outer membrane beta-barrel protein [Nitrospiraceae bacterium]|nr:outer membrane beta-barrel protein [Nitrospiraceae bacterium]